MNEEQDTVQDQEQTRILVVQNAERTSLGRFEDWWTEDGLTIDVVMACDGQEIPDLDGYAALVLLGGGLMPDEDEKAPWLPREREVAGQAVESGLPVLGICLGGQLLAHVGGGEVRAKHGEPESGSTLLTRRAEADGDHLFGPLPGVFRAIEHRVDAITELPPGALWLASSEKCPIQGFRLGERAWGLQFHPEVTGDRVANWNRESLEKQGFDPDEVVQTARDHEAESAVVWRAFAGRFASLVRSVA